MKDNFRRNFLLSLAFGALVFIGFTVFADAGKLASALGTFPLWSFAFVFVCSSMNYVFRFWKWDYYTRTLDMRPGLGKNAIIFFAAFIMAITPGKFGEVLKSYMLKQVTGTPIARSAPIILAERLTDFIGLVILMIVGAWMFGQAQAAVLFFALLFAGITLLLAWRRGSLALIRRLSRLPLLRRVAHHAESAYDSVYALLRPVPLAVATALSVASWSFESFGYWYVLHTFHAPPTVLKSMFIYAFSTIVGAISMLPGGLGTTEGSLTGLAMLAGAEKDIAVAATFLIRAATLWYAVVIGIAVMFGFQKRLHVNISTLSLDTSDA